MGAGKRNGFSAHGKDWAWLEGGEGFHRGMKKALPVILVLAALAVAIAVFLKRKGGNLDMPAGLAAELAPAETILFLEIPDPARTRERWKDTNLYKLSQEPEWKEFAGNWENFVAEDAVFKNVSAVFGDLQKADPAGAYLALTSLEGSTPKIVGGFPYRGKKSDVEATVRKLKEKLLEMWPAAKSELTTYEGIEVETLKDLKFTAAMAYRENWFFFATDTDLLLKTLSRSLKKADAPPSLAKDPLWIESNSQGSADPDLRLWAKWSVFAEKLNAVAMMSGPGGMAGMKDPNPAQAIVYTWKLDGPLMRDRLYFHLAQAPKDEPLANRSLGFTQPATYAYLAANLAGQEERLKSAIQSLGTMGLTQAVKEVLSPKGLKIEDLFTTFGPELAIMSAWEAGGITLPDAFAAAEVKDKAKARLFAEVIADEMKKSGEVLHRTEGDTAIWTMGGPVPYLKPTVAVNGTHLMFALNGMALSAGMKQLAEKGPNLATHPESQYSAALKTVVPPTGMLFYVDMKNLFERIYDKVKPMIAFSLVGNPQVGKHFDAAKLPQAATISRHLAPIILSQGTLGKGWLIEGTGSISFMSIYMVATPAALIGLRAPRAIPAPVQAGSPPPPKPVSTPPARAGATAEPGPAAPASTPAPGGESPKSLRPTAPALR
jgi:hypothetical protein